MSRTKNIADLALFGALRALAGLGRAAGARGAARLGTFLGDAAWRTMPRRRRIALANIGCAMPGSAPEERERICRESFRHFARLFFEVLSPREDRIRALAQAMEVEGLEHLERAVAAGNGVFYVTAHHGNWELMAHALALRGHPLHVLVRRTKNARLDAMMDRRRTMTGNAVIDKDVAVPRIREVLGGGGIVGILVDQNVLGSKASFVDFMGRKAATTPVVALLALRHRAAILCGFTERDAEGRYRVRITPVWDPVAGGRSFKGKGGIHELTQEVSSAVEREIRRTPESWLWSHERFKTRPGKRPLAVAVRMPNWIGDAVMAEPLLRGLRSVPEMTLVLFARGPVAELFVALGFDVVKVVSTATGERPVAPIDEPFHAVVVLPRSLRAALLALRLRSARRVGFATGAMRRLFTHPVAPPPRLGVHQVDRYLALLAPALAALRAEGLESPLPGAAPRLAPPAAAAARDVALPQEYVVLAPGAAYGSAKRWDEEGFATVGRAILDDCDVLVLGGPDEREIAERVAHSASRGSGRTARSLAGRLSIGESAAVLAGARAVVANDSGLMHLAAAFDRPVVGLFGATDPAATGPRGARAAVVRGEAPCSPCRYRECPVGRICWSHISAGAVLAALPASVRKVEVPT